MAGQVYQVMEALSYGDAVSHIALDGDELLREAGYDAHILSIYSHEKTAHRCREVGNIHIDADDVVLFHFWGQTRLEDWVRNLPCRKAIYYHNITPPHFFDTDSPAFKSTRQGREQLLHIAGWFDLAVGDSEYNVRELFQLEKHPAAGLSVPPPVDGDRNHLCDEAFLGQLKNDGVTRFLFLGRLAANKRQDDIIRVFDYYHSRISARSVLDLVGNDSDNPRYVEALRNQILRCPSRDAIHLRGKVRDEEVVAYLRAADVFLCLSEHEGYCVPLIQAMAAGCLVVGYDAAAVPETMGGAGVLVNSKDPAKLAELIHVLLSDEAMRQEIVHHQLERVNECSRATARTRLLAAVAALRNGGRPGPEPFWLSPDRPYGARGANVGGAAALSTHGARR